MQVWKFPLLPDTPVKMPEGAKILKVDQVRGDAFIWALVDKEADLEERRFTVVGTGWEADLDRRTYHGTFIMNDGDLVFHVFE